jgi:glutamate dehydrogenase/leucine dehydrogenase
MEPSWRDLTPRDIAERLKSAGIERAWIARDSGSGPLRASHEALDPLAEAMSGGALDYRDHEALFLAPGPSGQELFGAFIHSSLRGQAQGGLRHCPYPTLEDFIRDGLRLSLDAARTAALAGLWWGGGKGLISRCAGDDWRKPAYRRSLYRAYARFVSELRGCYVTAEDAGTSPVDMAEIAANTRFASCTPPHSGGSGNPSAMTALGVVEALEAALEHLNAGPLGTQRVAMQGGGNVGQAMLERLLEKGVASLVVSDASEERCETLRGFFAGTPLQVRTAVPGDRSILAEECDILILNALSGTLSETTIPDVRARVVCGAANSSLAHEARNSQQLHERGILYVPDSVTSSMGLIASCDEQAGTLPADPAILARLDRTNANSIYGLTRLVLARAAERDEPPVQTANAIADRAIPERHPIHGDRAQQIVQCLLEPRAGCSRRASAEDGGETALA